jgi:[ribosomal protein S18]-alanine N-acetyltransferase
MAQQTSSRLSVTSHIRWMIGMDLPTVAEIDRHGFPREPYGERGIKDAIKPRDQIGMVAERFDRVVGYMIYQLHRDRLHLIRLAVAPDCRRTGVGRSMVAKLIGKLSSHRRRRVTTEVADDALPAQLFLRWMGFRATAVIRGTSGDPDVYAFAYALDGGEAPEADLGGEGG